MHWFFKLIKLKNLICVLILCVAVKHLSWPCQNPDKPNKSCHYNKPSRDTGAFPAWSLEAVLALTLGTFLALLFESCYLHLGCPSHSSCHCWHCQKLSSLAQTGAAQETEDLRPLATFYFFHSFSATLVCMLSVIVFIWYWFETEVTTRVQIKQWQLWAIKWIFIGSNNWMHIYTNRKKIIQIILNLSE